MKHNKNQYEYKIKHKHTGKIVTIISVGATLKDLKEEYELNNEYELIKGSIKHFDYINITMV